LSTKNDIFIKKLREMVREELKSLAEKSPEGWEGTVKALKKHGDEVDNPWALAHWMKKKGYKSHKESDLPTTTKKGKTIKVRHKKSQKSLVVVDTPAVRKKYAKLGFFPESIEEAVVNNLKQAMSYIHTDTKDGAEFMKLMKQKSYNKKQAIRAFTLGMRGDAVHGAGPGGMSQFARHVTKHLKESVNEGFTKYHIRLTDTPGWYGVWDKNGKQKFEGDKRFIMKNLKKLKTRMGNFQLKSLIDVATKRKGKNISFDVVESVSEGAKAKAGDYVKTMIGVIAKIEKVRGTIAYMKLQDKKSKGYWLNDLKNLKSTDKMEKGKPLWTEGFGGELKGKDKEKFEKARKENAEQLGYKLTGKGDIREAIKFSKEEMTQLHQNGKLEKDGHTYVYKGK
jgi:hypothetical protein